MVDLTKLRSSITNFGSGFPEPKGDSELTSEKKDSFNAVGEILESKNRLFVFLISFLILEYFLFIKILNS